MSKSHLNDIAIGEHKLEEIVPVLLIYSPSEFAARVARQIYHEFQPILKEAVVLETGMSSLEGASRFLAPGFRQTLPFAMWESQPVWTLWCSDADEELDSIIEKASEMNRLYPRRFRHFLVKFVSDTGASNSGIDTPESNGGDDIFTHSLLLSPPPVDNAVLSEVIEGTASLYRMAWERYCESRDGNVSTAFHLAGNQRHFTMGSSTCRPDIEFHSERIGRMIASSLCHRMLQVGDEQIPPEQDTLRKRLSEYVEGSPIEALGDREAETELGVIVENETAQFEYLPEARQYLTNSGNQRCDWIRDARRLRKFQEAFSLLVEPDLEKRATNCSAKIEKQTEEKLRSYLALPNSSFGLCDILRKRLGLISDQLNQDEDTQINPPLIPVEFETDEKRLHQSIRAIPETRSIWLRAGMFMTGITWLVLGPWLFDDQGSVSSADASFSFTITVIALLAAIPVGVLLHRLYVQARAIRRFDTALNRIHSRSLWRLTDHIGVLIRNSAKKLKQKIGRAGVMEGAQAELDSIRENLQNSEKVQTDLKIRNRAPFFTDQGVDACVGIHRERWTETAWSEFRSLLDKQSPTRETIWPDAADWIHCLTTASRKVAKEGLESICIDEFTRSCTGDPRLRARLFHDHCIEAAIPSYPGIVPVNYAKVFVGPPDWREYRGNHDDWHFHNSLDSAARFIAIIPVNHNQSSPASCSS